MRTIVSPGWRSREQRLGGANEAGDLVGVVDGEILAADPGEQVLGENRQSSALALAGEYFLRRGDEVRPSGALVVHVCLPDRDLVPVPTS